MYGKLEFRREFVREESAGSPYGEPAFSFKGVIWRLKNGPF